MAGPISESSLSDSEEEFESLTEDYQVEDRLFASRRPAEWAVQHSPANAQSARNYPSSQPAYLPPRPHPFATTHPNRPDRPPTYQSVILDQPQTPRLVGRLEPYDVWTPQSLIFSGDRHSSNPTTRSPVPPPSTTYRQSISSSPFLSSSGSRARPTDLMSLNEAEPSQAPSSGLLKLHWQLLPYHPTRSKRFLHFDVTFPTRDIEFRQNSAYGVQRIPLSNADLDKPAADEKLVKMTINFQRGPFEWDIDVKRDEGIRVRDVFEAIYVAFNVPLTPHEKNLIPHHRRAAYEEAFKLRCKLAPGLPIIEQRRGWKRVDMLLHKTLFRGVTRPKPGGWVLNISGSAPVTRRNHYPKITVSNSSLILSKSRVEDEYLPPYPDHVPGSPPPIYSDVDLFNLPLSAAFASSTNEDSDVMLFSKIACRFCSSVRPSAFLQHRTLYTLIDNIVPDSTSQDNTWAFFCRFVPLSGLFDSPVRGPLPMTPLGSGRARLIESLELELENTRNSMTWLHGLPGTGKSVIAYTLASRCRQKHRLAGSFFFSRRHMNCRSAHSAVLALAYQLGLSDPLAKEKIVAALNSDPGIIFPSRDLREQFVRLLIEPLEALDRTSRVFVMDAVDQCQDQGPDLISLLTRLLSDLTDMGLHIFFTSRDEVFIKRHFAPVTSVSIDHHFAVVTSDTADISPRHIDIDSDIRLFLQQSFKKIHTRHRLQCRKPWPPDEILDHLVDGVGPYFDTASVIVKFVESPDHDPTDRMDLIRHVINPPLLPTSSVDDFYESIISTSHDIEQAYLHLTVVVSLVDMLSCSQLDSLLNRGINQKFDMHCVLSQLPPLVRIPAGHVGSVQVCHESLCDFLYDPLRCGERFISQALVHRLLAYSCLSVMIEEFPDDCTISSRLSQLIAERSASLGDFDDESVLSLVAYSPPDPLQLLHTLWHIKRHRVVGLTADPRTNLALVYFCCTWQILQHLDLSTFGTLPAFRFLEDIRSLPVLLAFPLFLSFEFPVNAQTSGSSTLQDEPHIEVFDAVAEIVNHVYVIKEGCRTGSGVLDYACTHWVYHLSLAEWDEDLRSILTAFMTQKLQQWIVRAWCLQDLETCLWTLSEVRKLCLTGNPPVHFDSRSTERTPEGMTAGGDKDAECDMDVDRPYNNDESKQREDLPAGAETPSPSTPATLDSDDNRKLWKLTENKEGKGEAEDIEDESHEDADPFHRHHDVRQVSFTQVESDLHPPLAPEAIIKDLVGSITKVGNYPVARGGFGEIWKCTYETDLGTIMVAVKSPSLYASDEVGEAMEKKTKRIQRELKTCLRLKHPNILPVHGYTSGFGPFVAIVSAWADNGNITTYLEREDTSLTIVKRFQILRDIAAGLQYLHTNNVIHGDLTGPNVLIHGDGTACLADFGLSLLHSDIVSISQASWTSAFHGNFRWLAPELLGEPEDNLPVRPSKYSDIYSFGGIMLQVLTSKVPYYYLGETAVVLSMVTGVKPSRSRYPAFSDKYWHFIEKCWSAAAQERPSAERVIEVISDEFDSLSSFK